MDKELSELMTCGICLDILTEPHQYPCGHSYCLSCITVLRNSEEYRCPECREEYPASTDVIKNYRLANIVHAYQRPKAGITSQISQSQGGRSGSGSDVVNWLQVMIIILASATFFKVLSLYTEVNQELLGSQAEVDICLADLEHQNPKKGGFSEVLWFVAVLPFWCVWWIFYSLYELLFWLMSSVFSIINFVLWNIIISGILLVFGIFYAIFNHLVYAVGCICILYGIAVIVCKR